MTSRRAVARSEATTARSGIVSRVLGIPLAVALAAACASPATDDSSLDAEEQPSLLSEEEQEEPSPIDEEALLLELGELLAEVTLAGGDALERTLGVTAADDFDPQCTPAWAHELLDMIEDGSTTVESVPGGIAIETVVVPAEVRFGRAVHLGGDCEGPLPKPDRSTAGTSPDPPPSTATDQSSAHADGSGPTGTEEVDTNGDGAAVPAAPDSEPEPSPEPPPQQPAPSLNVDARGNELPDGMLLPEAYDARYTCQWTPSGYLAYEWSIYLRGGRQYQFAAHAVGEGDFEWRYWSSPRDGKRVDAQGVDRRAMTRESLVLPQPSELRFFHSDSSIPVDRTDYWLDISHVQGSVDYQRLTCSGVDPR